MVNPDEIKSSTMIGVDGRILHNPGNEPELAPPKPVPDIEGNPPIPAPPINPQKQQAPNTGATQKPTV